MLLAVAVEFALVFSVTVSPPSIFSVKFECVSIVFGAVYFASIASVLAVFFSIVSARMESFSVVFVEGCPPETWLRILLADWSLAT